MESPTYLVTVSGHDRVGVGAELFAALSTLEGLGVVVSDVAQITIRGALVLCAEVNTDGPLGDDVIHAALASRHIVGEGVTATIERVVPSDVGDGRRLLVTLLAPHINASPLHGVFAAFETELSGRLLRAGRARGGPRGAA